jgi:hypothetical protein
MADDFDFSEVHKLAVDLGKGNAATVTGARKILEVAAIKIKKGMASDAKGIRHAPAFPASITYDISGLSAEIGPDKSRRQGALGNLLYFGSANNGPRIADIAGPLKAEAPIFSGLLSELAAKYLL